DGKTLKDIITEHGKLPPATAVQIAIRILSALRHAHEAGIIHRDIKPQNILVDRMGYIKVSDFGIARMVGTNTDDQAKARAGVMGSVHYFSPEQARGETSTFASDLYSVGIVLYEMLTGQVPFQGETPMAIVMQHLQAQPRPMRDFAPDVGPALEEVVRKAMAKDPKDRFASAMLMAQALHASLIPIRGETADDTRPPQRGRTPQRRARAAGRSSRALLVLLSVALLAALVTGTYYIYWDIVGTTRMPLLRGYSLERARREAETEGLVVRVVRTSSGEPVDTVITQSQEAGEAIKRGEVVLLTVSSGPARKAIPLVEGASLAEGKAALERVGLQGMPVKYVINSASVGTVLSQSPAAGEMMDAGGIVQLTISSGRAVVPDLSMRKWTEAAELLKRERLITGKVERVGVEDTSQHDRVASQLPLPGETVGEGTAVDIVIYVAPTAAPLPTTRPGGL
ncbi:MAG TPA: PASTA domain-containing protein, partial [Candidatus Limnocylindria bacterium]|nr:PASTA domain-containing protein [Candidatus Limnocylindria bacterium]